jgi:hypothetical protein
MAKAAYVGVGGTARAVKKIYVGVGGTAREVVKGYVGADGVAREFYRRDQDIQPVEFTFSGTSAVMKKSKDFSGEALAWLGGTAPELSSKTFEYSRDHGATWTETTWANANKTISLTAATKSLMLRGDLRTPIGNCCFTFQENDKLLSVTGSMASILGGADGTTVPTAPVMFATLLWACPNLTSISADLFKGIAGPPKAYMFDNAIADCTKLTTIPAGLFDGISGAPAEGMFYWTFGQSEPGGGLTAIPDRLFANIGGAPASYMFSATFYQNVHLETIPRNLFGSLSGTKQYQMFTWLFGLCAGVTGQSAVTDGVVLYSRFSGATTDQVVRCYYGCGFLSDYASIPANWK